MLYISFICLTICVTFCYTKNCKGGEKIAKKEPKNYPIFSVRIKSDKAKKDFSKFVKAKKEINYTTAGDELVKAVYEYMEREGWDLESESFIDFNDNDEDDLSMNAKHTHIGPIEKSVKLKVKRKPEVENNQLSSSQDNSKKAVAASSENTGIHALNVKSLSDTLKVNKPSKEELYTYAFCKVFGKMPEVHYDQIDQLALPFFKTKDSRAVENKPRILIQNQCIIRKPSNKKWFTLIPEGIEKFKTKNQHLEEILEKEVSKDFLDALTP